MLNDAANGQDIAPIPKHDWVVSLEFEKTAFFGYHLLTDS